MFIIGISGGSGSGKTTFIRDLKSHFADTEMTILSQDEYYKPKEQQLIDLQGITNFDLPTSIDIDGLVHDVLQLKAGKEVTKLEYCFNNKEKEPQELVFKPTSILVVEGLFIFHEEKLRDLLDFGVIIHASDVVKVIRRIKRDRVERNYPLEDVLYRYEHHVMPSFEKYILPHLSKVDIVINNNVSFKKSLDMMVCFLKGKV